MIIAIIDIMIILHITKIYTYVCVCHSACHLTLITWWNMGATTGFTVSHNRQKSLLAISSKVAACRSQPVAFNRHSSTCEHLTGLINKPQKKQTCELLAVVYWLIVSLLMELSIDNENCSLP